MQTFLQKCKSQQVNDKKINLNIKTASLHVMHFILCKKRKDQINELECKLHRVHHIINSILKTLMSYCCKHTILSLEVTFFIDFAIMYYLSRFFVLRHVKDNYCPEDTVALEPPNSVRT